MSEITVSDVIVFITEMSGENQRYKIIGETKDKKAPTVKSTKETMDDPEECTYYTPDNLIPRARLDALKSHINGLTVVPDNDYNRGLLDGLRRAVEILEKS